MIDHMQLQRKTVGQTTDTPTSVMSSPVMSAPTATLQLAPEPPVQAEPKVESAESAPEQEPQSSMLSHDFGRISILPKLSVSQPNDPYEQEADRVAAQVMRTPDRTSDASPSVQGFAGHDFGQIALSPQLKLTDRTQPGQTQVSQLATSITPYVQRDALPNMEEIEETESAIEVNASELSSVEEEEKLLQTKPALQQFTEGKVEAEHYLERQLAQSRGGGSPLPDETRSFMEARFGTDFSQVRVHTDAAAVQMNQALQAQAFTHGQDIYFGENQVPGKNDLTAHELTHTIQQTGHSAAYRPEPSLDSPMSGDFEQFGSASHRWGASSSQIQKQPISVAQAFSIQRRAGSLTQAEDNQDAKQTKSDAITAPSMRDERPSTPSIPEGADPTKENPYKSQPTTENKPASSQNNAQNIKQNHKIAPPTSTGSAANDPDFQAVAARGQEVAQAQQQHDPAESESKEAQDAAQAPSNEVTSKAQDQHVGEMAEQQPGEFNAQAFKDAIFKELEVAMPGNLEAAENFDQNNDLDSVRQKVSSDVGAERDEAAAPIEETTQEEPDPSGIEPKLETPMQPPDRGVAPGAIGAERATPKPKSDAEVSQPLEANQQAVDQRMAEADITEEQLANANEPEFSAALDARREVKADAEQAPAAYRQQEQTTLSQAQAEAQTTAATQLEGMHNQRQDSMAQVEGLQGETKSADEQKRTEIADHINGIYERVKEEVETSLSTLETDVTTKFDTAADTARRVFEDYIKREKGKFLLDRYVTGASEPVSNWLQDLGVQEDIANAAGEVSAPIVGGVRAADDLLTGLPPEVEQIFVKGREQYLDDMSVALDEIATTVATRLNEAMQKIKGGREDIRKYVESLPANLRQIGREAATSIESKFDDLEQQVRDKHDQLVDTLAQKYQEHLKEIDSRIEEMIAENRGLFDRAMDAIGGVIQTINEIKAMLQGLLADAMTAIGMILRDPIGFLDNLLKALNQGFNQFLENIGKHLQSGLIGWLTGAIGTAGIQMPENIFSLEGIFSLAAQILGLGWDFIRDKAIGMFGESTVGEMEESVDIFQILKNDGLKGLWQQVQSQFTDLKETVMDEVQSIITVEVMQAGVTWILSLFSPASAFIRAAKMIVDVVIFFVENASQIMELVQAVIQSITAIASGSIGAAANAIESALAKAIPVLIGLLASLLGLGGLANKVRDVFERLRKRIEDAIEKLLQKAKELFKGKKGKDNDEENASDVTPEKQHNVDDATPRQDADDMESDRDITSPSSNRRRKSNEQQSDEDASVDTPDRQRLKDHQEDTDTTPDAKRDRRDDQDSDAPRQDKSDQPDQRRHDQDDPDQQRRRERDQDSDSSPGSKRDRDDEDGDRKEGDDRTDRQKRDEKKEDAKQQNDGQPGDGEVGEIIIFIADDESHRLWINTRGASATVMVASDPGPVAAKLTEWEGQINELPEDKRAEASSKLATARQIARRTDQEAEEAVRELRQAEQSPQNRATDADAERADEGTERAQRNLVDILKQLFELFGDANQGPLPEVGPHPLVGKDRESNHVPEAQFAVEVQKFYRTIGNMLSNVDGFDQLGQAAIARANEIQAGFANGNNLPAILIHRDTHRLAPTAVHSSKNSPQVMQQIKEEIKNGGLQKRVVLITRRDEKLLGSIRSENWRAFIHAVYKMEADAENRVGLDFVDINVTRNQAIIAIRTKKASDLSAFNNIATALEQEISERIQATDSLPEDDEGRTSDILIDIKKRTDNTMRIAHDEALRNALSAVQAALAASKKDGDPALHGPILRHLREYSQSVWTNIISALSVGELRQ